VFLLAAGNESRPPIGYLGLGGEVAALSDFVLAGVQIQPLILQNLATYSTMCGLHKLPLVQLQRYSPARWDEEYHRDDRDEMIKTIGMQRSDDEYHRDDRD
jgi:hypothetical protein